MEISIGRSPAYTADFVRRVRRGVLDGVPYDVGSIMHYSITVGGGYRLDEDTVIRRSLDLLPPSLFYRGIQSMLRLLGSVLDCLFMTYGQSIMRIVEVQ